MGITSYRPGKAPRAVFQDMAGFTGQLKSLPGVSKVEVQPGQGIFFGEAEPTWVVSYRGNGEARKLMARTGKRYGQDGVLMMKPCRGKGCDPSADFIFEHGVDPARRQAVHEILSKHGIGGGTWYKAGGQTVLNMVSVPAYGGERAAHLAAMRDISAALSQGGLKHRVRVRGVKTEILSSANYDSVIGGQQ